MKIKRVFDESVVRFFLCWCPCLYGKQLLERRAEFWLDHEEPKQFSEHFFFDLSLPPMPCMHVKNVIIVDTSNEIAGDGNIPHRQAIGESRRIMVPQRADQHRYVMSKHTTASSSDSFVSITLTNGQPFACMSVASVYNILVCHIFTCGANGCCI